MSAMDAHAHLTAKGLEPAFHTVWCAIRLTTIPGARRVVAGTLFSDLGQGFGQWKAPDNIFEKVLPPLHVT